jgi:hypothetical protein
MFIQTWNKYLPVIRILLKRSVNADQTLDMNQSDFQRASGGKKVKYTFSILLIKGRLRATEAPPPLAKDLVTVLQQDDVAFSFLRKNELEFAMNNSFQLVIKNKTPATEPGPQTDEPNTATDEVKPDDTPQVPQNIADE